ncbi:MAG: hypothetical protein QGG40_15545, partial [Myxococcota bacterium]|nr:hypothetical protein [Myxococcota bacterium]
ILVVGRSVDTAVNGGAPVDVAADEGLTLANDLAVLTYETEGAAELFSEMVAVGITGSGIEMGLQAAELALSEPLVSEDNAGFLREDAALSVIYVSDEDDYSPEGVNHYLRALKDLKGDEAYRNHSLVNVSAVVGATEPEYEGLASCESENGEAAYGHRYVDLASRTGGALESICDEDFTPIAHELGLTVSGLELEFELSELCDENSLVVSLYATDDDDSFIEELVKDTDYTYVVENNAIRFEQEQLPEAETYIVVEYRILAVGTSQDASDDTGGSR